MCGGPGAAGGRDVAVGHNCACLAGGAVRSGQAVTDCGIDDATSQLLGRFVAQDSTAAAASPVELSESVGRPPLRGPGQRVPADPGAGLSEQEPGPRKTQLGASPQGTGHPVDRSALSPGQRTSEALLRDVARPASEGVAAGGLSTRGKGQRVPGSGVPAENRTSASHGLGRTPTIRTADRAPARSGRVRHRSKHEG